MGHYLTTQMQYILNSILFCWYINSILKKSPLSDFDLLFIFHQITIFNHIFAQHNFLIINQFHSLFIFPFHLAYLSNVKSVNMF